MAGRRSVYSWASWFALSAALALAVGACGGGIPLVGPASPPKTGLKFGFIVEQTGSAAAIGAGYLRGTTAAIDYWNANPNNRQIELQVCDNQSTGEGALSCYRQLQDSSDVILGPHLFLGLASVKSVAATRAPALLAAMPFAEPPANSFLFQTVPVIRDAVEAAFIYYKEKGLLKVATLTSNDQPGNLAAQAAKELAPKYGIQLVATEVFDPAAQNLAPQAERIAATRPNTVLTWTAGPQIVIALRALKDAKLEVPVMLNYASMSVPLLKQAGPNAPSRLLFFATGAFDLESISDSAWKQRLQDFNARYVAKHSQNPDLPAYAAADAAFVAAQAAQTAESKAAIKDNLESGRVYAGFLFQNYSYSKDNHVITSPFSILLWHPDREAWTLEK